MELTGHTFETRVIAKSADAIEAAAKVVVTDYFGADLTGVTWSIDTGRHVEKLNGEVVQYIARVSASRG